MSKKQLVVDSGLRFSLSDGEAAELAAFLLGSARPSLVVLGGRLGQQLTAVRSGRARVAQLMGTPRALDSGRGEVVEQRAER